MMKIKFTKPHNFKPPPTKPAHKINRYSDFGYYYITTEKGPNKGKFISTSGNFIPSDGYNYRSWIGWFETKKEAETLLKSLGVTYE